MKPVPPKAAIAIMTITPKNLKIALYVYGHVSFAVGGESLSRQMQHWLDAHNYLSNKRLALDEKNALKLMFEKGVISAQAPGPQSIRIGNTIITTIQGRLLLVLKRTLLGQVLDFMCDREREEHVIQELLTVWGATYWNFAEDASGNLLPNHLAMYNKAQNIMRGERALG